jgi:integrase
LSASATVPGPRTPIKARFGSPEFAAEYHAAIRGEIEVARPKRRQGTLAWLVAQYQASSAWSSLAKATKKQRANILKHVIDGAGDMPIGDVTRAHILDGRERRARTPSQANNFLNTMRYLFKWAVERELMDKDPTDGVKSLRHPEGGFHPWSEEEIASFEARWPIGTRERLALEIFLCTGLRRGDAARLGRQHVRNGVILIRAEKTGAQLAIPVLKELQATIEATPTGNLTFLATANGKPMTKESLGNWFRDTCQAAGVPGSARGLRKAAAARLANASVSEAELDAIMGWTPGSGMSRIYTRTRDAARLAAQAIEKFEQAKARTVYSQPDCKVGSEGEKA